jgi:hypothetical protein
MGMHKLMGIYAVIPASLLLTVSFLVLVIIRKQNKQVLKAFGYVVTAFLWLASLLVFASGAYTLATGKKTVGCMMGSMMKGRMHEVTKPQFPPPAEHK